MTGDEARGLIGAVSELGSKLVSSLPPSFIGLLLINAAFLTVVLIFLDRQLESRMALATKILDHCLAK